MTGPETPQDGVVAQSVRVVSPDGQRLPDGFAAGDGKVISTYGGQRETGNATEALPVVTRPEAPSTRGPDLLEDGSAVRGKLVSAGGGTVVVRYEGPDAPEG